MPRNIFLFTQVNSYSAETVIQQLLSFDRESNDEITMFINSPGGSVLSMFSIIDMMKAVKSPIRTIVIGTAASAAAVIASCGDKRLMSENSEFMIHEAWSGAFGTISEMDEQVDAMQEMQARMLKILSNNTGKTEDQIMKVIKKTDKHMTAKEAKRFGLVDEIMKSGSAQVLKLSESLNVEGFEVNTETEGAPKVQLLKTGTYDHPEYGQFDITTETLNKMKENFESNVRGIDLSIDYTHDNDSGENPAACWIKNLTINDDALIADVEFTPKGEKLVSEKEYKYASADFCMDYVTETGEHVPYVLRGGTLTNRPFIKEMNPIKLSERKHQKKEIKPMNKEAMLKALSEEHGVNVSAMEASLSESKTQVKDLQNKIQELSKLPAEKDEEIKKLKSSISELTNDMRVEALELAFNALVEGGKVVPAQKEVVLAKFDTAEVLNEFYKDAPTLVKIKPEGSSEGSENGELTAVEEKLVKAGKLTKEEILANRRI